MLMVVLLGGITLWHRVPQKPEVSNLYRRYCDVPGMRVGFVKGFPIGDSLTVDVTTFEALTDEAWQWMIDEFYIRETLNAFDSISAVAYPGGTVYSQEPNSIMFWVSAPEHPELWGSRLPDTLGDGRDCVLVSPYSHWLAAFHAVDDEERSAIIHLYMRRQYRSEEPPQLPRAGIQ